MGGAPVERVVIVGGGLAAWTAAAAFASSLKGMPWSATVVELPDLVNIEPVQYTLPPTLEFFRHVGIDEAELIRRTAATYRLGSRLLDWHALGKDCIRAYGKYGADIGFIPFHHYAVRMRSRGDEFDYADFSPGAVAARLGRMAGKNRLNRAGPSLDYGLQLNTDKLAELLRTNAMLNGVEEIRGQVDAVELDPVAGRLESILLADGRRVTGNLFIDASGSRAILGTALGVGFIDWSHWLPCDRTASITCTDHSVGLPLLDVSATDEGWLLRSSLQHRNVRQLLYASGCTDDERAADRLVRGLDMATADALVIGDSPSGHRRRFWAQNCVAIGSCAGHIEALEVTGLHLIQSAVLRLLRLLPSAHFAPRLADEYNRETTAEYEALRDYVLLHRLAASRRGSGPFSGAQEIALPDSLAGLLELFTSRGRFIAREFDPLTRDTWVATLLAAGYWPAGYDPLLDVMSESRLVTHFDAMRVRIERSATAMPTHADVLAGSGR